MHIPNYISNIKLEMHRMKFQSQMLRKSLSQDRDGMDVSYNIVKFLISPFHIESIYFPSDTSTPHLSCMGVSGTKAQLHSNPKHTTSCGRGSGHQQAGMRPASSKVN